MLGLRFCVRAFSSCGKRGPLLIAMRGPLTIAASPVVEHRLQMRRLSNCGSRAQPLCGMWDPPRPGLEPVSPALAGRLSTTALPGKPKRMSILKTASGNSACSGLRTTALGCLYNEVLMTGGELISHWIPGSTVLFNRGLDLDS